MLGGDIELSCLPKMLVQCYVYLALHSQLLMLEAAIDDIVLGCDIELSLPYQTAYGLSSVSHVIGAASNGKMYNH
jgi:hypothetical protein